MELAIIGMGKMGANMAARLVHAGHRVVAFDRKEEARAKAKAEGCDTAATFNDVASMLTPPRAVWVMVPSGDATETTIQGLVGECSPGDTIIDGGNSHYVDSMRHAAELREQGFDFLDVGTSGGIWGLTEGYCMMIGGDANVVERLKPIFQTLAPAPDHGWGHVGPNGSGHFVKMVHNGIEYGVMQAYAEGFALMEAKEEFDLDTLQIAEMWRYGSVVRSWLLDLIVRALVDNPTLEGIAPYVPDSGEGRWTVMEAINLGLSMPVITAALERRFRSRETEPFGDKLLAVMREQFGGHAVKREGQ
jgi:6-phosphogluconate dehydrogenase